MKVKTSLSGELAEAVSRQELDFAFLTSPIVATKELTVKEIADEPLYVIGPASCIDAATDAELAQMMPFISFKALALIAGWTSLASVKAAEAMLGEASMFFYFQCVSSLA